MNTEMVAGPGSFSVAAVGEASYVGAFEAICGPRKVEGEDRDVVAVLVPEPTNSFDPNAVFVSVQGRKVGYLSRDQAITFAPMIREYSSRGVLPSCHANIRGGWVRDDGDFGFYGIWLDLPLPGHKPMRPKAAAVPEPAIAEPPSVDAELRRVLSLKTDAVRRRSSSELLAKITDADTRTRVRIEIVRHETKLVLDHVAGMVSEGAKRKRLEKAIQEIEADDVPDDLQIEELKALRGALSTLRSP